MNRAIDWDLIADEYDHMIKYATSIKNRTASTEAILRRFTGNAATPPTRRCRSSAARSARSSLPATCATGICSGEINPGTERGRVVEPGNSVIFFGKGGDIATNRRDEQELSVLCLRVLQASLVYVNTLMIQDVLADRLVDRCPPRDRRALTPLFWQHVAPYGEIKLDMRSRLTLATDRDPDHAGTPATRRLEVRPEYGRNGPRNPGQVSDLG